MPSKKKVHMEGKVPFWGGRGKKKGPNFPSKRAKKSRELILGEGGIMTRFPFSFSNKSMPRKNYKIHPTFLFCKGRHHKEVT